jgi:hypothetical protein
VVPSSALGRKTAGFLRGPAEEGATKKARLRATPVLSLSYSYIIANQVGGVGHFLKFIFGLE